MAMRVKVAEMEVRLKGLFKAIKENENTGRFVKDKAIADSMNDESTGKGPQRAAGNRVSPLPMQHDTRAFPITLLDEKGTEDPSQFRNPAQSAIPARSISPERMRSILRRGAGSVNWGNTDGSYV